MENHKIILQYEGTRYNGWQKNKNAPNTIQDLLEKIIGNITGENIEIIGSGRTDAGVHALGQVANFKLNNKIEPITLMNEINNKLPSDIKILSCNKVEERFHSRYNAVEKTYKYTVDIGNKPDVFRRRTVQHYPCQLDFDAMEKAINYLVGEQDFKSFTSNKRTKKSTVRTIFSIDIVKYGSEISLIFRGNGFLHNMVRILAGTLLEVGIGKIKADDIEGILKKKDRSLAGATMEARGLTLVEVRY